jgi:formyltetrahydrofolate deformylase
MVADFVFRHGGNVVHAEQHIDRDLDVFFQRIEFELEHVNLTRDALRATFGESVAGLGMQYQIRFSDDIPHVAILVSKQAHCLYDLLSRFSNDEFPADLRLVISNHPDHADIAQHFGIEYRFLPVIPDTKAEQEQAVLQLLADRQIDLVILARYMQVLSDHFIERYPSRIINIHHSFLPAFIGGRPYHQAYHRGVKIVGVTAHYATADLDEGPIIDQDVVRISHRDTVEDLIRKGRDLEKIVLARAVLAHVENRILVYGNKTVVFG